MTLEIKRRFDAPAVADADQTFSLWWGKLDVSFDAPAVADADQTLPFYASKGGNPRFDAPAVADADQTKYEEQADFARVEF